jgi:hypothetical protein
MGFCTGPPGYIGWQNQFLGLDSYAEILEQYMGAKNRVGIALSYRPARLAESITWNRLLCWNFRTIYGG